MISITVSILLTIATTAFKMVSLNCALAVSLSRGPLFLFGLDNFDPINFFGCPPSLKKCIYAGLFVIADSYRASRGCRALCCSAASGFYFGDGWVSRNSRNGGMASLGVSVGSSCHFKKTRLTTHRAHLTEMSTWAEAAVCPMADLI